ncbi:MAG TPA: bifunctional diaminohydroxyphosphoribosylaminopyrimidine deaminase/5-amino-6-(5-phosphoribosylamino)uracil reductase RibD [Gaiellaceae bacterium]|nr:bifunctional diaminohydroxyphosphoribosylaminopyrimidine deaminase/5-amino-6-(5-phosphoribosylamino)uracil reductase RibD [Gaiellaceae bacterium]
MTLARAIDLARGARDRAYPKPTVGAVVVSDGEVVGEGATEAAGRHAEVVALAAAGERARNATLYVSLEPCDHHGTTPPCTDAILAAGVERVVFGARDPNPEAAGGAERLRAAGIDVEFVDSFEARAVNEAWRTWVVKRRPFVVYKAAMTLDGRVTVPGERWVTGEESRRAVHELRAVVDAVAVGGGTARADRPRLDARGVETPRGQPRRLVFSRGPLPDGLDLELRSGPIADELHALAAEGVQSLLLEGGPTLAAAFLEADLVDKILLFVAPTLAGAGPTAFPALPSARTLARLRTRQIGADVLLEAYVHDP